MRRPAPIRTVVFDIGWVLMRMNYRPLLQFLGQHGAAAPDRDTLMRSIRLEDHETGRLCGRGLLERIAGLARAPVALEDVQAKWLDMFVPDAQMIDLAHRLSEHHRVYLLSNIGDLHWSHLSREYRLHGVGHGVLLSYLAGVMKPHAGIYSEAERRFALTPAETVFIDDRADNIAGARARGWHGIVHEEFAPTVAGLRQLGITC